jgi:DNA-binding XRE family transcriptional regulator
MSTVSRELAKPLNGLSLYGYRRTLGLSQVEAARLAGISRRQLQRLEAETLVTPTAVRLATTYLGAYLLAGPNGREAA